LDYCPVIAVKLLWNNLYCKRHYINKGDLIQIISVLPPFTHFTSLTGILLLIHQHVMINKLSRYSSLESFLLFIKSTQLKVLENSRYREY